MLKRVPVKFIFLPKRLESCPYMSDSYNSIFSQALKCHQNAFPLHQLDASRKKTGSLTIFQRG